MRSPTPCSELGEVTIVAPTTEASAIGHALTLRRPLRLEAIADARLRRRRHADRLRQRRGHARLQRPARSRRLRHQQGLEPGRRCDLFRNRGGRARRRAARDSEHRRVAAPDARRLRFPVRGAAPRRRSPKRCCGSRCRRGRFSTSTCRKGEPKGYRVTVQAKRNHVTSVAERHDPKGHAVLLDRRRPERVGAARSVGLSGGARRLRVGDAAASRPDGAPRARRRRGAVVRKSRSEIGGAPCAAVCLVGVLVLAVGRAGDPALTLRAAPPQPRQAEAARPERARGRPGAGQGGRSGAGDRQRVRSGRSAGITTS